MNPRDTRFRPAAAFAAALALCLASGASFAAVPQTHGWPRQFTTAHGNTVVVYQPQAETLKGDTITGRAAVSWTKKGETTPKFGVVFFTARVSVDREAREVSILHTAVNRVRFPGITPEREKSFAALLEEEVPRWQLVISYDRLLENLKVAERERRSSEGLKNEPPKFLFAEEPAVLVTLDGEPQLRDVEGEPWKVVVNTPVLMLLDTRDGRYYLSGGKKWWYRAPEPAGPWQPVASPPADIAEFAAKAQKQANEPASDGTETAAPPKVIVSAEPAELIVSEGKPAFAAVDGADLLSMTNTESIVLMDVPSQDYYVLVSGRWFRSRALTAGGWTFVPPDALPESFKTIPADSEVGEARASIPGTDEAEDALLDAQLPQTAAVRRSEASLEVRYDGEPSFVPIEGTDVEYAANASAEVLRIRGRYYACDDAVWYVADAPAGPWTVADSIPREELDQIPPSAPVYNVRYVTIYDSTPEVVYVGYTPGYLGCYAWGGTVFWGTGWYYSPWIGPVYYWPWPWTWGFCAHYSPWFGWGFGISWSYPFFDIRDGWGGWFRPRGWGWDDHHGGWQRGRWWGPGGYRPPAIVGREWQRPRVISPPGTGHPRVPGPPRVRPVAPNRRELGFRPPASVVRPERWRRNVYDRLPGGSRVTPRPTREVAPKALPSRPNNVYAGRDGDVYRRMNDGRWQQREGQRWVPAPGSGGARPAPAPRPELQRDYQARQRGEIRSRGSVGGPSRPAAPRSSPPARPPGRR